MHDRCIQLLSCPICHLPLAQADRSLRCENGHNFDVSREGYVNLLPGGRKRFRIEGDAREMLRARRSFLEAEHYRPLALAIHENVRSELAMGETDNGRTSFNILDAGCGEGYYLGELQGTLQRGEGDRETCFLGIDLSKEATKLAARRYREALFVVGDTNERLPVQDASIQVLLNLFAPRNPAEFARVLVPTGLLLVAIPQPSHLIELRERFGLLQIEEDKRQRVETQLAADFSPLPPRQVAFELSLKQPDLTNLVQMTPNYWHLPGELRETIQQIPALRTQVAVTILPFRRR